MRELDSEFDKLGVEVRFVVIGDAKKVAAFCSPYGMADRCIPDPNKATFKSMGFGDYNLLKLFSDKALLARRRENKKAGFSQNWGATRIQDGAQLPGAALIDREGRIVWKYAGVHPGDLPNMRDMLEQARTIL